MSTTQTKLFSDQDDSDDMGTGKTQAKPAKKRKRNTIKRFDDEQHETAAIAATTSKDSPYFDDNKETEEKDKKKTKREKKTKPKAIPKNKAPLNLDRQCGVLIAPFMNPCTRSLTCKVHAMGAKRAVQGRTRLFNDLLAAYQKKGIGRPQVPAESNQHGHQQESSSSKSNVQQQLQEDSDEEAENVRMAIEQNRPSPLGCRQVHHVRRKREYHKLRGVLLEAITPKVNPTTSTFL